MGTHLRQLSESYPMNTNMTGFRWFSKNICVLVFWSKVALALEWLKTWLYPVYRHNDRHIATLNTEYSLSLSPGENLMA